MVGVAGSVFIGVRVAFRVNEFGNFGFRALVGVGKEVGCGAGVLGIVFRNFLEFMGVWMGGWPQSAFTSFWAFFEHGSQHHTKKWG